jgi:hypothetical protein
MKLAQVTAVMANRPGRSGCVALGFWFNHLDDARERGHSSLFATSQRIDPMPTRRAAALISCSLFLVSAALAQPILPPGEEPPRPPSPPAGGGGGGQTAGLQIVTPEEVAGILKDEKYFKNMRVEAIKVGERPALRVASWRGFPVIIIFVDCKTEGCLSVEIITGAKAPSHIDLQYVNAWNLKFRFTKMTLDKDNNYQLRMDANFAGGVTRENVISNLLWYDRFLELLKTKSPLE